MYFSLALRILLFPFKVYAFFVCSLGMRFRHTLYRRRGFSVGSLAGEERMQVAYTMKTADEALEAAFEAGAIKVCPKHEYNIIRTAPILVASLNACTVGADKIGRGLFSSEHSQFVLAVLDVIDLAEEECHCCANTRAYQAMLTLHCIAPKPCPCSHPTCPTFGQCHTASRLPEGYDCLDAPLHIAGR